MGIFQHDGVNRGQVEQIVDSFPGQSIDFFGAMRARVYDDKVIYASDVTETLPAAQEATKWRRGCVNGARATFSVENVLFHGCTGHKR